MASGLSSEVSRPGGRGDLLAGLNEAQKRAVLHERGSLLILAGAGSGKTRVITVKIAWLIREKHVDPRSILAVTFTNKAAAEMRERAALLADGASDIMIRTFHSFGAWLLRRNARVLGLDPAFTIYDDDDVIALLSTLYPSQNRQMLGIYARQISRAKDYGLGPSDDLRPVMDKPDLAEVYERYEKRLREIGNCDFGDLILLSVRLLRENPEIKRRMQSHFATVLVDEYQDSNIAQHELIKELVGPGTYVCVVGDDDQSIYRFRGADVRNIVGFPQTFPGTELIRLEQNYRSTNPILRVAGAVVEHNSSRLGKTMWTDRTDGESPTLLLFFDSDQEAEAIVRLVSAGKREGTAILYRTNAQSRAYEAAFLRARIPYRIVGTLRFYEREEVKDTLAMLRILANPRDEIAFRRVVNKPARGLGPTAIDTILAHVSFDDFDVIAAARRATMPSPKSAAAARLPALSKKAASGLSQFMEIYDGVSELLSPEPLRADREGDAVGEGETAGPDDATRTGDDLGSLVAALLEKSGLRKFYEDEDKIAGTQKLLNLDEMINAASLFPADRNGLVDFLEAVELDSGRESEDDGSERVTLITMHNTKGLEFDTVYITGLEDGLFPRADDDEEELEEERRLFYVALTRARDNLILCSCRQRRIHGRPTEMPPSRFLSEIPSELIRVQDFGFGTPSYARNVSYGANRPRTTVPQGLLFPKGTAVYHDDYGSGEVVKSWISGSDEVVIVHFETGRTAQFIPKYSSLEKSSR